MVEKGSLQNKIIGVYLWSFIFVLNTTLKVHTMVFCQWGCQLHMTLHNLRPPPPWIRPWIISSRGYPPITGGLLVPGVILLLLVDY